MDKQQSLTIFNINDERNGLHKIIFVFHKKSDIYKLILEAL
jgi:hypothetical protein